MGETLKNGQAFLCIKDCYYKTGNKIRNGKLAFTKDKIYFIDKNVYLLDNLKIHKNYSWYKEHFVRAQEHDKKPISKPFYKKEDAEEL